MAESEDVRKPSATVFEIVNHTDEKVHVSIVGSWTGILYNEGTAEPNSFVQMDFGSSWVPTTQQGVHLHCKESGHKMIMETNPVLGEVWRICKKAGKYQIEIYDKKDNSVYIKNGWAHPITVQIVGYLTGAVYAYDEKKLAPNEGAWLTYSSVTRRIQKEIVIIYGQKSIRIPNPELPENGIRHTFCVAYDTAFLIRQTLDTPALEQFGRTVNSHSIQTKEMAFSRHLSEMVYGGEEVCLDVGRTHKWNYKGKSVFFKLLSVFSDDNVNKFLVAELDGVAYLSFKGTDAAQNVIKDVSCTPVDARDFGSDKFLIHAGIWTAVDEILDPIKKSNWFGPSKFSKIVITGHSLGGGMAIIFAGWLYGEAEKRGWLNSYDVSVYTFGCPQVLATDKARKSVDDVPTLSSYQQRIVNWLNSRVTNCVFGYDIVPTLPLRAGDADLARFVDALINSHKESIFDTILLENDAYLSDDSKTKVVAALVLGAVGASTMGFGYLASGLAFVGANSAMDLQTNFYRNFRSSFKKSFLDESSGADKSDIAVQYMGGIKELQDFRKYFCVGTTYIYQWDRETMWEMQPDLATKFYHTNIFKGVAISSDLAWQCISDHKITTGYATTFGGVTTKLIKQKHEQDIVSVLTGRKWKDFVQYGYE